MKDDDSKKCCACSWFSCCNDNWQKVMQSCPKLGLHLVLIWSYICHFCVRTIVQKMKGFCVVFFIITFSFIDNVEWYYEYLTLNLLPRTHIQDPTTTNKCFHKHVHLCRYLLIFSFIDLDGLEILLVYIPMRNHLEKKVKFCWVDLKSGIKAEFVYALACIVELKCKRGTTYVA